MIYAVIDLGSNTFHLMIIKITGEKFVPTDIIFRESYLTSLSAGGGATILKNNWDDSIRIAEKMKSLLDKYKVGNVRIIGTAVLRTADNKQEFLQQMETVLQKPIHVIDGETEAKYIGEGSLMHPVLNQGQHLILDIGGGSTECIFLDNGKIRIKASFPLGIGVLKKLFFINEVITQKQISEASVYVNKITSVFIKELHDIHFDSLTGASGTFEAIEKIHFGESNYGIPVNNITIERFKQLHKELICSDLQTRLEYPNMPFQRASLLPAGLFLINYFIEKINPELINISHFALKEGVLKELMMNKILTGK
jgi:exopolyphosphatase/guanosine-5'-triphosphate,3'-diphosphate pyrophosphatase